MEYKSLDFVMKNICFIKILTFVAFVHSTGKGSQDDVRLGVVSRSGRVEPLRRLETLRHLRFQH